MESLRWPQCEHMRNDGGRLQQIAIFIMWSRFAAAATRVARTRAAPVLAAASATVGFSSYAFAHGAGPFDDDVPADYVDRLAWRKRALMRGVLAKSEALEGAIGDGGAGGDGAAGITSVHIVADSISIDYGPFLQGVLGAAFQVTRKAPGGSDGVTLPRVTGAGRVARDSHAYGATGPGGANGDHRGISFVTWDGVQANPPTIKMRVTENGKVGIGTSNPQAALHVSYAGGHINGLRVHGNHNRAKLLITDLDTSAYLIAEDHHVSVGGGDSWRATNLNIHSTTGHVGIGTKEPQAALDVTGNVKATGFLALERPTLDWSRYRDFFVSSHAGRSHDSKYKFEDGELAFSSENHEHVWGAVHYDIKTNFKDGIMYRISVEGYAYDNAHLDGPINSGRDINSVALGYLHSDEIKRNEVVDYGKAAKVAQYRSHDGFLVIQVFTGRYCTFFSLSVQVYSNNVPTGTEYIFSQKDNDCTNPVYCNS